MLNIIQRLCGIATHTQSYVKLADPFNVKILDTRKTTPGMRVFEKYAVKCGGGYNHRFNLSTGILIKDNHIQSAGSISKALEKISTTNIILPNVFYAKITFWQKNRFLREMFGFWKTFFAN